MNTTNVEDGIPEDYVTVIGYLAHDSDSAHYLHVVSGIWYTANGFPLFDGRKVTRWRFPTELERQ